MTGPLTTDREERKNAPVFSGVLSTNYFGTAIEYLIKRDEFPPEIDFDACFLGLNHAERRLNSLCEIAAWAFQELDRELRDDPVKSDAFCDQFIYALVELSKCSVAGNKQHCNGQPLVWDREKSNDHEDCLIRHWAQRGTIDTDKIRHTAKVLWRSLALIVLELERMEAARDGIDGHVVAIGPSKGVQHFSTFEEYASAHGLKT